MTPIYALVILSYSCPFMLKWVPQSLAPFAGCQMKQELELYVSAEKATERASELGPNALFALIEADSPLILRSLEWQATIGDRK
jgi:hypothetical protein